MSYAKSTAFSLVFAFSSVLAVGGCSAASDESTTDSTSEHLSNKVVTIDFASDFTSSTTSTLAVGETAKISYDASRLTACRGNANDGSPGWSISAFYRVNGGPISSVTVGGHVADPSETPTFPLTAAGDLEIWFQNTSMWGCSAYDSAYGANYHFTVVQSATAPGWVGEPQTVLSRATCGTPPNACDSDFQTMTTGFTYDTWTRQQAAIRRAYFQAWKQGTTDFDNSDIWKELDVEIHSRIGGAGDFATAYVNFDARLGNNARYAVDLSTLDPFAAPGGGNGSTLTDKSQCPQFPVSYEGPAGADSIDADVQFYFTVNGTELRPAPGGVFHGKYQNYAGLYAICR
ncbi:MAG: DUF6209 family protein [Polyangiaceae bacterium]